MEPAYPQPEEKDVQFEERDGLHLAEAAVRWDVSVSSILLQTCKRFLANYYGDRLLGLILYGSAARQQSDSESDIDLLVLLRQPFDFFVELRRIIEVLYPIQLESTRLISAKPATREDLEAGKTQLYRNAKRDGVLL